ncbi:hypothetical protein HK405_001696 [Cladochytrium tenue]|nr:hypothetical protein HK405_001696 [Cladochytrium tenue]
MSGPADDITAAPPAAAPATAQADAADGDLAAAIYESLLSLAEELGPALPAGASPAQLAAVPRVPLDVVMSAGSDSGAHCCPVCLEPFAAAAAVEVLILPGCGHMLHAADECGPGWLRTSRRCPTCRIDFADALVLP